MISDVSSALATSTVNDKVLKEIVSVAIGEMFAQHLNPSCAVNYVFTLPQFRSVDCSRGTVVTVINEFFASHPHIRDHILWDRNGAPCRCGKHSCSPTYIAMTHQALQNLERAS